MVTIFINSENIKTSDASRLLLNLADKTNLKRSDICDISEYVAISNLSIYYPWKKIHKKNNTFKATAEIWNDKFELSNIIYQRFKIILSIL